MLSLKRSIDRVEADLRVLRQAVVPYRRLLSMVRETTLRAEPDRTEQFLSALEKLEAAVLESRAVEQFDAVAKNVEQEIDGFREVKHRFWKDREKALEEVIHALGEASARLSRQAGQGASDMSEVRDQLERAAHIPSIQKMRETLLDGVRKLEKSIESIQAEAQASAERFETQLTQYREQLNLAEHQATRDELTGLLNRRAGESGLKELFESKKVFSLLVMDLNGFKYINDTFGHSCGDQVLRVFAAALARAVRPSDLVVRWGGDEFVALLPGCRLENALLRATDLERKLSGCYRIAAIGRTFKVEVGVAIGVAEAQAGDTLESVFARADEQLYAKKPRRVSPRAGAEKQEPVAMAEEVRREA